MFITMLLASGVLIALSVVGLGIRMLVKTDGVFPETHISRNKAMRSKGITCAQNINVGCHPSDEYQGCGSCQVKLKG